MSLIFKHESELEIHEVAIPIHICRPNDWRDHQDKLSSAQLNFATHRNFSGEAGQRVQIPDGDGNIACVLFGAGSPQNDMAGAINLGGLSASIRPENYVIASMPDDWTEMLAAMGWGLGAYKFDKYLSDKKSFPVLVLSDQIILDEVQNIIRAIHFGRDLINIPAGDMGPVALEEAAETLADNYGATKRVTKGDALLNENYPMIHAVGRAAHEEPRLVELEWGDPAHPRLALVGKGITFDTGGLNIKSATSARLMKKDMGGAAHALALAQMIMANKLPIRLHVLLAIAENAISAGAFRPGDILPSRAGLTVEIDNTDAEGRLVLGDALVRATEDKPALIIDFATLTGAARVALGPKLAPFYCNRTGPVQSILDYSKKLSDPIWHMPLWNPYLSMLKSPIADMKNAGGGFAGSVTAALFLQRFVGDFPWMHFDVYGWNPTSEPGHPKGGEMFALRSLYEWLKNGGIESNFDS